MQAMGTAFLTSRGRLMLNKPVSCDMMLFPSRPERQLVCCQKIHKIRTDQVIRSERELVSQKRERMYAHVVEYVYREGSRSPTQKCANSNGK